VAVGTNNTNKVSLSYRLVLSLLNTYIFSIPSLYLVFSPLRPFSSYIYLAARVILIYNILVALLPLIRPKDNLDDIPLTPAQRKLLGLPASDAPPTPGSQYVTPPRYARTPTSKSGSPSSPFSNTPLSGKGSPIQGSGRGSTFSPNASPLLHKAMAGGLGNTRRGSYGSPSPLGPGVPKPWFDGPTSPSPSSGKGTSVGLNSKWLYEKGRGSPGNSSLFS
jgi:nucleoporin POM34